MCVCIYNYTEISIIIQKQSFNVIKNICIRTFITKIYVYIYIYVHHEYIMRNAGLEEAQAEIKIARRNINNLRYANDTTLMAESEEELKCLFHFHQEAL